MEVWRFAVAVLSGQTGAGQQRSVRLTPVNSASSSAVGVHPGQELRRGVLTSDPVLAPHPLAEAVLARDGAPIPHLDEGVALGVVSCHSRALWDGLLLQRGGA